MAKISCMRPPETGLCNAHLADTKSYNTRLAETFNGTFPEDKTCDLSVKQWPTRWRIMADMIHLF
jgi:hypothetical protein